MIRDGEVIGSIGVCREEPGLFADKHVLGHCRSSPIRP